MNKSVFFGLFLTFLIVVTAFNVYARATSSDEDLQAKIKQLQADKRQVQKKNQALIQTLEQQSPAEIQSHHDALVEQVSTFINTAFVQSSDTYQERKKEAQTIMSAPLLQTFFPTDTYKGETKTSVQNIQVFIETGTLKKNHATLLIRFDHALHALKSEEKQVSSVFLEVDAQRQDGRWMMTDFTEATKEG